MVLVPLTNTCANNNIFINICYSVINILNGSMLTCPLYLNWMKLMTFCILYSGYS
jgi:hypothetical protein